jgi:hypothetical protein
VEYAAQLSPEATIDEEGAELEIKSQQRSISTSPHGSGGAENNYGHRAIELD